MLKVLLVDDEPFIIQGLKVIIDWENEEFEIAGTASNGKEALQFLENENVDLVIADITSMVPVRSSTLVKAIMLLDFVVIMRFLTTAHTMRTFSPSCTWASSPVRALMV